jgi:hypothetical protein
VAQFKVVSLHLTSGTEENHKTLFWISDVGPLKYSSKYIPFHCGVFFYVRFRYF